jgi:indolepyruvate ferredoxin oxidoreductase
VTVHGARPKKALVKGDCDFPTPPRPAISAIGARPYGILVTGVGGTGVVTIGAILGMAAHLEGKGCGSIDMAGLAQKGGAVYSHVKIAERPEDIHAIRVAAGEADLVLGCDLVVSGSKKVLAAMRKGETGVLVNTAEIYPGDFTHMADFTLPVAGIKRAIRQSAGDHVSFVDATGVATALLGNSIAANMFMLGHAWQQGLVPLDDASILRAIELNGEAVEMNKQAFLWGRRKAADSAGVEAVAAPLRKPTAAQRQSQSLDELIARRVAFLAAYQDSAYAGRYQALINRVREVERAKTPGHDDLTEAAARYLFKLMAVKDEYEVARLYVDGTFARQVEASFDGELKLEFHLAPPIFGRRNAKGEPVKSSFGPWIMPAFKLLAKLKRLRGTPFDIFGYAPDRRIERKLIADYEIMLNEIFERLSPDAHATAVALASIPEKIRGYGHVKMRHLELAKAEEAVLLEQLRAGAPAVKLAAE